MFLLGDCLQRVWKQKLEGLCINFLLLLYNYHKCNVLKNTDVLSYSSGGQKSEMVHMCLTSRCWQKAFFLELQGENLFPLLWQILESTCIPWLIASSSTLKDSIIAFSNFSLFLWPLLPSSHLFLLTLLPPSCKNMYDYIRLTLITLDTLPIWRSFISHICKIHLTCVVTYSQVQDIRVWTFFFF